MWCRIDFCMWLGFCVLSSACGSQFLYNAPSALVSLVGSASASASRPSEPLTHIANLRAKQQKAEKLQAEKQLVDEADNGALPPEEDEENKNEASPSLLQKKLHKILTKIRFISALAAIPGDSSSDDKGSSASGASNKTSSNNVPFEEFDVENDILKEDNEGGSTESGHVFQKIIYPDSKYGPPIKVRLNLNEKLTDDGDEDENEMGRLSQIGVFFAELLGSIVGLVYGAAAQLNNVVHGTAAAASDV